jgi:hypothetical protein
LSPSIHAPPRPHRNMDLDRIKQHLTVGVAIAAGMLVALFVGQQAGVGNYGKIAYIFAGLFWGMLALVLQQRTWILIPLFWACTGQLTSLPAPVSLRELIAVLTFVTFVIFLAFKIIRTRPEVGAADILLLTCLVWLAFAFARNPTGLLIFQTDRVGARPYFAVLIATLAYWVLSRSQASPTLARRLPWGVFVVIATVSLVSLLCEKVPQFAGMLGWLYSDFDAAARLEATPINYGEAFEPVRYWMFDVPGRIGVVALCAFYRPLSLLNPLRLWRFLLFGVCMVAILVSGFRSGFIYAGMAFLAGSYLHRGKGEVIRIVFVAIPLLAIAVMAQGRFVELPLVVQRTLSFLPGEWDFEAKLYAQASTTWRTEMWEEVVKTDRYIENKVLGDGFGLTREQVERIRAINSLPVITNETAQENAKITGAFHSGPLNTIRVFGGIGLVFFYWLLFAIARLSLRLLWDSRGTPFYPLAILFAIRSVVEPVYFTVVFGAFENDFPETIFRLSMLKMLQNSLVTWAANNPRPETSADTGSIANVAASEPVLVHHDG